jgi:murein DD-endopeptidase MepM/ murein hydrolase activator NlpD
VNNIDPASPIAKFEAVLSAIAQDQYRLESKIEAAIAQFEREIKPLVLAQSSGGVPERVLFCSPVTGQIETGANIWGLDWFDASPYGKQHGALKHYHTGDDLNRPGYWDSGAPVYCTADGVVDFVGQVAGWQGDVVIVEHALEDGSTVWTRYAHIKVDADLDDGEPVSRGQHIGYIADYTPAGPRGDHLHYDVARIDIGDRPGDWPGLSLERVTRDYIDPVTWHRGRSK